MADPETEWWFWTIIALIILGISACVFEYFMERRKDEDLENDEIQIVHKKIRVKNHRNHKRHPDEYDDHDGHYDYYENDVKSEDDDSEETLEYQEKRRRKKHRHHNHRHGPGFHMPHAHQTGGGPVDPNDLNNYAAVNYHPKYEYNFFIPTPNHGPLGPPGLGPHGPPRPPFRKHGPMPKSDSESKRFPGRPMPYPPGPYAYPPYPPYPVRMPRHPARPQNLSISSSAHNPTPTRRPVHKQAPHPKPTRPNYNYVPPAKVVPQTHETPFEEETSERMAESDTTYNDVESLGVESLGEIEDDVELLEVTQQLQDARRALDIERENARMREQHMAEVHQNDIEMMVLKHEELEDVNDSLQHTMNQEKERNRQEMERNRHLEDKLQEELRGQKALEQALKREHDIHAQLEEQLWHMKRTPKADYMEKKMEKIKRVRSKNRSVHGSGKYSLQSLNSGRFPSHSHSPSTGHLAAPMEDDTRNRKESWLTEISGTDSLDEFDFEQQKRKSYVNDQLLSSLEQFEPGLDDAKSDHSSIVGSENSSMRMPSSVPSVDFDINKVFDRNVRQFESAIGSAMHDILEAGEDTGLTLDPVLNSEDVGVRLNRVYSNADEEEVEVLHRFTVEKHSTVRRITLDRATTLEKNTYQNDEVNKIMADAAIEETEMDDVLAELHALIGDADYIQEQEIGEMEMLREQIEEALALADDDELMSIVDSPPNELPPTIYGAASPPSVYDTLTSDPNTISSAYDASMGMSSPHHDMIE